MCAAVIVSSEVWLDHQIIRILCLTTDSIPSASTYCIYPSKIVLPAPIPLVFFHYCPPLVNILLWLRFTVYFFESLPKFEGKTTTLLTNKSNQFLTLPVIILFTLVWLVLEHLQEREE